MISESRRTVLAGALAAGLTTGARLPATDAVATKTIEADLARYVSFGNKRAGGSGDAACGKWLAGALEGLGYRVERQTFDVPFFDTAEAVVSIGDRSVSLYAQPIVVPTPAGGLEGPLVRIDGTGRWAGEMTGAIALLDLPHGRWSSLLAPGVRRPVEAASAAGAIAVIIVTNGPSGTVVALNADGRKPMLAGPIALVAPSQAGALLDAAAKRERARLLIRGVGGKRPAFNFVGQIDRNHGRWLAVSTPRSGWFTCAAERGPGIAVWLDLARWARNAFPRHDLAFICNTGHEYEYLGAAEAMKQIAPPVAKTAFWLHLGANVAGRDWRETMPPVPLASVDPQRFLSITPTLLEKARQAFAGQPGLEVPVSSAVTAAGELEEVIRAGYASAAGVFGTHRFHHSPADDSRCLLPAETVRAAAGFRRLLSAVIAPGG